MVKPFPKTYENFKFQISWEDLDLSQVKEVIKLGLYEDAGGKFHSLKKFPDITTKACKINNSGEALIVSREPMVVCGLKLLPLILESAGAKNIDVDYLCNDGDSLQEKITVNEIFDNYNLQLEELQIIGVLFEISNSNFIRNSKINLNFTQFLSFFHSSLNKSDKISLQNPIEDKIKKNQLLKLINKNNISENLILSLNGIRSCMKYSSSNQNIQLYLKRIME